MLNQRFWVKPPLFTVAAHFFKAKVKTTTFHSYTMLNHHPPLFLIKPPFFVVQTTCSMMKLRSLLSFPVQEAVKLYLNWNREVATSTVLALSRWFLAMVFWVRWVERWCSYKKNSWFSMAKCWFTGIHSANLCVCVLIMVNLCPVVWSTSLTNRVLNARFRLVPRASFRGDPIFDHVCFGLL